MTNPGEKKILVALEQSEVVQDPLFGLVERSRADPGAPFERLALERLAKLYLNDRPAYETLRLELKIAGVRVGPLEEAMLALHGIIMDAQAHSVDPTAAFDGMDFFHTPKGEAFVDIRVADHRETMAVGSADFAELVTRNWYARTGEPPGAEALRSSIALAKAKARFDGPEYPVHLRVASASGKLYVDLGDPAWRAVEIDQDGWRVVADPPVRFRRPRGYLRLPDPQDGGRIDLLRNHVNLASDDDFAMVVAWLLAALRDRGPYPVLVLTGEQGAAKSTFAKILKLLVDPSIAPLRVVPNSDRDLLITAENNRVLAYDNVSALSEPLSDAFCRLSTGGGLAIRTLYTNAEETLFDACRPLILNGIEDIVARPDLGDRALTLLLSPIAPAQRKTEEQVIRDFTADQPLIFGAVLDVMVHGLRNPAKPPHPGLPRLADFASWAIACEAAVGPPGSFMGAYDRNRRRNIENIIERDPVCASISSFMVGRDEWIGSATDLHAQLTRTAGVFTRRVDNWPQAPSHLSARLRRAAPALRAVSIQLETWRDGHDRRRLIRIFRVEGSPP